MTETSPLQVIVDENQFALLSSPARSAIATIWVSGNQAAKILETKFESTTGKSIADFKVGAIHFGYWSGEGVVLCRIAKKQYELHCHGGIAAQESIANHLRSIELKQIEWATLDQQLASSRIQAEASHALRLAKTERIAAILLDQYQGALQTKIDFCIDSLNNAQPDVAITALEELLANSEVGLHLIEPYRIVIAGRPNVGKSSLINCLLGFERAIVFDQPGTTRDVLRSQTAIDGWHVELSDTAGLRQSDDQIEAAGVDRANTELRDANQVILVIDWSAEWTEDDRRLLEQYESAIVVFNKIDLPCHGKEVRDAFDRLKTDRKCVGFSALKGSGIEIAALIKLTVDSIVKRAPGNGEAVPFNDRQVDLIRSALEIVKQNSIEEAVFALKQIYAVQS